MKLNYSIYFNNLETGKQEEIINEYVRELLNNYQIEGEEFLKRGWNEPKPKTWQEAYIRTYDIEWRLWETAEDMNVADWNGILDDYARTNALDKLLAQVMTLEVNI